MFLLDFRCHSRFSTRIGFGCAMVFLAGLLGCSGEKIEFRANFLHAASAMSDSDEPEIRSMAQQASQAATELLGPIDAPEWPADIESVVDMVKVRRSAGPVGRDQSKVENGLFRKHCVQCHGLSGDGFGPAAALLAPYPRDFRRGSFKFKSTPIGRKPTHADIVKTLENGLPGTAMPAFRTLNESEEFAKDVDALAHYVRFLAIRGEWERRVLVALANGDSQQGHRDLLIRVANDWREADSHAVAVPEWKTLSETELQASIARGKELFQSELTACSKCHGVNADGKGISQDYDDWTKDWTIRAGIDPANKAEWKTMKKYGALKPVLDPARNLHLGVFRGGSTRQDIYTRLVVGIEGSPMPAVARKQNDNPGLTEENILDLVEYVLSVSSLPVSGPAPTGEVKDERSL